MALTLREYRRHVRHALGGEPSTRLNEAQMVNEGGRHLFSMHSWNFRTRPSVILSLVGDQDYVDLPDDFGELVSVKMDNNLLDSIEITTLAQIDELRNLSLADTSFRIVAAISYPDQADDNDSLSTPRLELWPTPPADTTKAITLRQRSLWAEMNRNEDVPNIQPKYESLLIACVRAVALGYEEDSEADVDDRLAKIKSKRGGLFDIAVKADGRSQGNYGVVRNGAVQTNAGQALGYLPYTAPSAPA